MRLFVAMELPHDIKTELMGAVERFRGLGMDAKWVRSENMHVTLKFLGEVPDEMVLRVKEATREATEGIKRFDASLEDAGTFGRPPRVVWIGLGKGKENMINLIKNLESRLNFIRKEEREPSPHITLGRIRSCRDREGLIQAIEKIKAKGFGEFRAEAIELKKSVLVPQGPVYSTVETFDLG